MLADKILPVPDDLAGVARRLHGQDIGGVTGRGDVLGINLVRNLPVLCHKAPRRTRPHVGVLIRQLLIGGRPQAEGLPGPLDALLGSCRPTNPEPLGNLLEVTPKIGDPLHDGLPNRSTVRTRTRTRTHC